MTHTHTTAGSSDSTASHWGPGAIGIAVSFGDWPGEAKHLHLIVGGLVLAFEIPLLFARALAPYLKKHRIHDGEY